MPDVSYDADPAPGYPVYTSYSNQSQWLVVGGTSAGAPQWAAIKSLGFTAFNDRFYAIASSPSYSSCFRDITMGSNGNYAAARGYDLCTGLGSPLTTAFYYPPGTPTLSGPQTIVRNVWYTYTTNGVIDPDEGQIRYHLNATGPGTPYQNTTIWVSSGTPMNWNLLWEPTDNPGTYLLQAWVENSYGMLSNMASISVNMVNRPPNTPSVPSGPTSGYVYAPYYYYTSATDPDQDNVRYEFSWGGGTPHDFTYYYPSGTSVGVSHYWTRPGFYTAVQTRAQDIYGAYSGWSSYSPTITIKQYDACVDGDAGNNFTSARLITPRYTTGTVYQSSPVDTSDWYQFNVTYNHMITVYLTPPPGVNFDLELYDPSGTKKAESHLGLGSTDIVCFISDYQGWGFWRAKVYIVSGEGLYQLCVFVAGGGGGTCPTLFVWNGTSYVDYGVINIHNPDGEDVVKEVPVNATDVGINSYKALFRLREGWPGLNFSESVIDQVKLYALDSNGNRYPCPLIKATHSRLGNVLLQLRASDDWKVQTLLLETIDLTFLVPYPQNQIQSYVFVIEGCNFFKN